MQYSLFSALALAAVVAAESATPTTSSSSATSVGTILATGTTLPALVTETESCALLCYEAACVDSGCSPYDFACVCQNPHSLVVKMGLCVGNDCDDQAQFDSGEWMADICSVYNDNPGSSAIAEASSLLAAEISDAAATATDNPVPSETIDNGSGTAAADTASSTATSTTTSAADASRPYGRWAAIVGGGAVAVAAII